LNQFTHIQDIKKDDLYFDINKDILKSTKTKNLFYPIYNLPTEKDNILNENKDWRIYEIYTRDYIQKVTKNDFQFLNLYNSCM
jgi:hypothetical protein